MPGYLRDFASVISTVHALPALLRTVGNGDSSAIDTNFANGIAMIVNAGAVTGTLDVKLTESDTSGGSYTDVTDGAITQLATAGDEIVYCFQKATKRYLKVHWVVGTTSADFAVVVQLYDNKQSPNPL